MDKMNLANEVKVGDAVTGPVLGGRRSVTGDVLAVGRIMLGMFVSMPKGGDVALLKGSVLVDLTRATEWKPKAATVKS